VLNEPDSVSKILLELSSLQKGFLMKTSLAFATAAALLFSLVPAGAGTIYPIPPCRVYDDTVFIQIPDQCGTVVPFYPRKLFLRSSRKLSYYYYPY
jgi:hypothetical protein